MHHRVKRVKLDQFRLSVGLFESFEFGSMHPILSIERTTSHLDLKLTSHWPDPGYLSLSQPGRWHGTNFGPALRPSSMHLASRLRLSKTRKLCSPSCKSMPNLANCASNGATSQPSSIGYQKVTVLLFDESRSLPQIWNINRIMDST